MDVADDDVRSLVHRPVVLVACPDDKHRREGNVFLFARKANREQANICMRECVFTCR